MTGTLLQTFPLGTQWPTVDPFLFCAHHDDAYPIGDGRFGPAAALDGRTLGQDFAGIDGWNMYHGRSVPGFPQHPHRGFETVTFVRRGIVDHADSLGAVARFGRGDVQWLTAGAGIVHSEMFPLLSDTAANPLQLFQIWLNLPASDKMVEPYFTMLWADQLPTVATIDDDGRRGELTVITGSLDANRPPAPPPNSWAARAEAEVHIWHVRLDPGATVDLPAATHPETNRAVYLFAGDTLEVGGEVLPASTGALVATQHDLALTAGAVEAECLVLGGRPIGEPVAQYGPFVMNDRAGIEQTLRDYQRTQFGGWPWPSDDPVHGPDDTPSPARFARHPDGRTEQSAPTG